MRDFARFRSGEQVALSLRRLFLDGDAGAGAIGDGSDRGGGATGDDGSDRGGAANGDEGVDDAAGDAGGDDAGDAGGEGASQVWYTSFAKRSASV